MVSREFELALHCARSRSDCLLIKEHVYEGVNWQTVLELARRHAIRPLLLRSLKSACWDDVPKSIQLELECFNRANVQKNLLFAGELLRLLAIFQKKAIPIAAFKGPILAHSVYGDLSLREFCDLDIIVHEADLCKAEDILTTSGYRADFPDRDFRSAFLRYQGQYAFRNGMTGVSIDLHWRLSTKGMAYAVEAEEVWPKLGQVTIAGQRIPTLANEDLALYLAAHGTKEGWRTLIWVCDFAEFLRNHQDLDWNALLRRAQKAHCSHPLLLATFLAAILLDAPAPPELLNKACNNSTIRALGEAATLRMFCSAPEEELTQFLNGLKTHGRLRHKIRPVVTLLTTRTVGDYQSMRLPRHLWSIYYFSRPFRLAGKLTKLMISRSARLKAAQ
jgi:hypothetical protein